MCAFLYPPSIRKWAMFMVTCCWQDKTYLLSKVKVTDWQQDVVSKVSCRNSITCLIMESDSNWSESPCSCQHTLQEQVVSSCETSLGFPLVHQYLAHMITGAITDWYRSRLFKKRGPISRRCRTGILTLRTRDVHLNKNETAPAVVKCWKTKLSRWIGMWCTLFQFLLVSIMVKTRFDKRIYDPSLDKLSLHARCMVTWW